MNDIIIANPIYDSVFKILMSDNKSAKILVGALLKVEILNLELRTSEFVNRYDDELEVCRVDFAATICDENNKIRLVTIELQKAHMEGDVMRFRRYLANHYRSTDNVVTKNNKKIPYHIVSIYILGYSIENVVKEPVIYIRPKCYDVEDNDISESLSDNYFINGLIHDMIIVQVQFLRKNIKSKVEKYLSIFDQTNKVEDDMERSRLLRVKDDGTSKEYAWLVRKLNEVTADKQLLGNMEWEDDIQEEFNYHIRREELMLKEISKQQDQLNEKDVQLNKKDVQLNEKNEQLNKQQEQLNEKDEQIAMFIKHLSSLGLPIEEIAKKFNIDEERVKEILK